ncbi:neurexin-4 isoform X3 [Cotesia typhae]|uniref:neurexin-4 isoform X3 n=1 Tax=Cotesia typhae TaxID=2053667 RepID=UPI003D68B0DC
MYDNDDDLEDTCESLWNIELVVLQLIGLKSLRSAFSNRDYFPDEYECNSPLFDRAQIHATSYMKDREPHQARLYGKSAWTPSDNSYNQHLTLDLGDRVEIRSIQTRGRANTREFVTEFIVEYSDDGQAWTTYESQNGVEEMFKGNVNAESIKLNRFEVPIIAQWIRINPTRWQDRISMRLELFGCDYVSDVVHFEGSSLIRQDLQREKIETNRHAVRFRFKTNHADGVIAYSRGTQGDYIAVEMRDNKMHMNIDLGSGIPTSLSVGSLLDDNMWHDVQIFRNRRDISFSVDRVVVKGRVKGDFHRLDLNRAFYIGGVPNKQEGLTVTQNFTGCIENFMLNKTNVIRDLKDVEAAEGALTLNSRFFKNRVIYGCPEPQIVPVTFVKPDSFATLSGYDRSNTLNVSLAFRSYEEKGLIMYHKFASDGFVKLFLESGRIKVQIQTPGNPETVLDDYDDNFNDGKWHQVILTISKNSIILNVDGRPMNTKRLLNMLTGSKYLIGGGLLGQGRGDRGFVGCMRQISIDGIIKLPTNWKPEQYEGTIIMDACQMLDRCNPNPCKHDGICTQTSDQFHCNCEHTGYSGAVCHIPEYPLSCEAYKNSNAGNQRVEIKIDVDGSGPLDPFPVTCMFYPDKSIVTIVRHSNELPTPVEGYEEAGSFQQEISYDADFDQITALMNRSTSCRQHINYACKHSRLFNTPVDPNAPFRPNSWWVSRNNQNMDYWGGALPGSRKCECGILGNCVDPTKWCNCDAGFDSWNEDGGDITEKEHLPVRQLRFGDTGTALDEKEGRYTLGPLECQGDNLFENVVTFRKADATIDLPTFDMGHEGDIYFEFKTTTANAVIIHSTGPTDSIRISINSGKQIQFQYKAGDGYRTVSVQTSNTLNDDNWHSVSVERNRKEAKITLDGALKNEIPEPAGPVRALHLTSQFVIGATTNYRDGYVGCIRALLLNGKLQDLKSYADRGTYGIGQGCVGKCASNPCLNNGTCIEAYDKYECNCRFTAFKGPICADEIGVNLSPSSMIRYDFSGSWRSTLSENIRVGFVTTEPHGFILGLFSNKTKEYMTISVSNSGKLRIVFDFGFERQEFFYGDRTFHRGQYHDVRVQRKNSGATMVVTVDGNEPIEQHYNIKASADAQFNNIEYMYIGRNESMTEGFKGCVSRVQFDDIYPLKLFFQQNRPSYIRSIHSDVPENTCAVEPTTHPPDVVETRPPPIVDEEKVRAAYNETDTAILGGILTLILLALIIMAILIGRYMSRHKGEYLTQEDKGAELALDPDSAVVHSATGHQVQKKKEWFI